MKKTLISATLLSTLVLAGCSSSGGSAHDNGTEATPERLPPVWSGPVTPEDQTPDRTPPTWGGVDNNIDPDFGIPAAPVQPPIIDGEETPDRLPPTWGGVDNNIDPDFGLPTDQTPDRPSPDFGEDMPTWGGECGSTDGGANCGALPPKPGVGVPDRPIPEVDSIDRQSVRDSIRARLNR